MAALFGDITARDDRDLVRAADCGESVRDDDGGSALTELVESLLNENFRGVVKRAGCLVKDEDRVYFLAHGHQLNHQN